MVRTRKGCKKRRCQQDGSGEDKVPSGKKKEENTGLGRWEEEGERGQGDVVLFVTHFDSDSALLESAAAASATVVATVVFVVVDSKEAEG